MFFLYVTGIMKSMKKTRAGGIFMFLLVVLMLTLLQAIIIMYAWNMLSVHFGTNTLISPSEALLMMILSNMLFGSGMKACGY